MKKGILIGLFAFAVISQNANAQLGKFMDKAKSGASQVKDAEAQCHGASEKVQSVINNVNEEASTIQKSGKVDIYFSKAKFNGSAQGAITDFTEGDYIYGHIIFPKPMKEYVSDNTLTFDVGCKQVDQDNSSVYYVKIDATKINQEAKELDFDVLAKPSEASTLYADRMLAPSLIAMVMSTAQPGVKTEFNWSIENLQGNFFLTMKGAKSFANFVDPILKKANSFTLDVDAMKAVLPEEFTQKNYAFADPQLSKANIIKYLPENIEVLKFVVGPGEDYKVIKNELGIIVNKQTARYIMVAYKDKKTGNCYYANVIFERPYEGNAKYGSLRVRTNGERIDCNKIR